ncbi:MAG: hypothetical protein DMG41_03170 [Acidobacteria bacterium]|nr:MAG: hypothetical protein AUH13_14100 [Acidobacteria bacterium 13_2_20CM_58_27]PYT90708.1 MAG: hypothetical protein DMG41_03170 [Acidobacteriota bacterium]
MCGCPRQKFSVGYQGRSGKDPVCFAGCPVSVPQNRANATQNKHAARPLDAFGENHRSQQLAKGLKLPKIMKRKQRIAH